MRYIMDINDFVLNEELKKLPAEYKYTSDKAADIEHNRLASKKKDDHRWKKGGSKKSGTSSVSQSFKCECGYKKQVDKDEDKNVTITYSK